MAKAKTKTPKRHKRRPPAPGLLQQLILRALDDEGLSRYWLAQRIGYPFLSKIYERLERPTSSTSIELMLAAMDAEIRIGEVQLVLSMDDEGEVSVEWN